MSTIISVLAATLIATLPTPLKNERAYQDKFCEGIIEHRLPDRTRVDCLTDTHAIEYDFARKWAESIGQSLHYAMQTGRRAGIVLITDNKNAPAKVLRVEKIIENYNLPIDVFIINIDKGSLGIK